MAIDLVRDKKTRSVRPIDATKLARHSVVLAQSGSGKSFMLGRLIEEIALKTQARIVIFDPNSDFIRLTSSDPAAWANRALKKWFYPGENGTAFDAAWSPIEVKVASNYNLAGVSRLTIDWGRLEVDEMASAMGINPRQDSILYWCLFLAAQVASETWDAGVEPYYDFEYFRSEAERVVEYVLSGTGPAVITENPLAHSIRQTASRESALAFRARVETLAKYAIWRATQDAERDIEALTTDPEESPRVLVVDLQSLETDAEILSIASRAVNALWARARAELWESIRDRDAPDPRVPTFLVIDEAHNLIPERRDSPAAELLAKQIIRIAAEGRKYGLHLIVASQRPRKLDLSILSECDNLFLMKMTNDEDLKYAKQVFGFLSDNVARASKSLATGDILLAGAVAMSSRILHVAPRRTVQGGRGLSTAWAAPVAGAP